MKRSITTLFVLGLAILANAQTPTPDDSVPARPPVPTKKICTTPGLAFGVAGSSNGYGANLAITLNKRGNLILMGEYKTGGYALKDYVFNVSGQNLLINADVTLGHIGGFIDWHPFSNSVKIKVGYAIVSTAVSAKATPKDSTKMGLIMIPPSELGEINTSIKFKPSAYIGIGLGRAVPKKRVGFTLEVGAYYVEKPDISFKTTGMLEPTSSQEPVIKDALGGLSMLGYVSMSLNFRLTGNYK